MTMQMATARCRRQGRNKLEFIASQASQKGQSVWPLHTFLKTPLRGAFPAALVTPLGGSGLTCRAKMSNTKTSEHTWWQRPSRDPSHTVCEESQHHVQKSMLGSLPWSSCSDLFSHKASELNKMIQ